MISQHMAEKFHPVLVVLAIFAKHCFESTLYKVQRYFIATHKQRLILQAIQALLAALLYMTNFTTVIMYMKFLIFPMRITIFQKLDELPISCLSGTI